MPPARFQQRRLLPYILITASVLFLFYFLRAPTQPDLPVFSAGEGQRQPLQKFNWAKRKQHYPVKEFRGLPEGKPKKLPPVQFAFGKEDATAATLREKRRGEVKKAFERSWKSYRDNAWLQDELAPISGTSKSTFGGWAATLVDTLDTLWIMGLKKEFDEAVAAVALIDFSSTSVDEVNVFETTIRYLGGFLSAYDLSGDKRLLKKAVEVADMLYVAFDTPNRMPITRWNPIKALDGLPQEADQTVLVAEIGSLTMEFTRLSQITDDPKWYDAVARIMDIFKDQQSRTDLPGMWPVMVNARDADFTTDRSFTLGGMADSLYEYFPKTYALLGGLAPLYRTLYEGSMNTAIQHLLFKPMVPDGADILAAGSVRTDGKGFAMLHAEWQHLVCFAGGMFALGGRLFEIPDHVTIGQRLTDACVWTYKAFPLGIMPEISHLVPCPDTSSITSTADLLSQSCPWDEALWKKKVKERIARTANVDQSIALDRLQPGITAIPDRRYILRPEAIESVFVLYRITGAQSLQAAAWDMFTAIQQSTQTDLANAALADCTVTDGRPPKLDSMEVSVVPFAPTPSRNRQSENGCADCAPYCTRRRASGRPKRSSISTSSSLNQMSSAWTITSSTLRPIRSRSPNKHAYRLKPIEEVSSISSCNA
ncbi:Endoplasmic reticulum mannosyl-oligosaccharide 1,2-alpha-mannosidase [Diplodia seriata]|uniref:alpha-1,2-Mannosidase n=1 Tax=Diplodia seriata TaxID=420778 RepID=A0A1S8BEX8_9PEZI|nr:Endoplasmic reticulum mannosyl-oligosaccharide 1,2-alpha-mannosidase [Diplodia seriata]